MDYDARSLKRQVDGILRSRDFVSNLDEWTRFPARRIINPLLSSLCSSNEIVKWRAVTAIGVVVSHLADRDMESARIIMRRLIWSLNDESGGIGWGAPEAMAEIMASHEGLAHEYAHMLISYIDPDGNPLENDLLMRGVLWGIGRLGQVRTHLVTSAVVHVAPYISSSDARLRGLALWALASLEATILKDRAGSLLNDCTEVPIYINHELVSMRISDLAKRIERGVISS